MEDGIACHILENMHFQYNTLLFLVSVQKCFCSCGGGKVHLSEGKFVS